MFEPLSSSPKSILFCDAPFLEGACDLPFKAHNADVPEDLLLSTPIHGWDTPPASPITLPLDGLSDICDPLLTKVSKFLEDEDILPSIPDKFSLEPIFDWTPPPSPVSDTSCDEVLNQLPYLNTPAANRSRHATVTSYKTGTKRKSPSLDEESRKKIKEKSEQERAARTAACEEAVKKLTHGHGKNDEDPDSRRHTHNVLERKRRNDLKNSYQLLREHIPSLEENERAPTGQILLHAVEYISQLKNEEAKIAASLSQLRATNEQLRRSLGL